MRTTARQTRDNRTITVDFHNEDPYVQLLGAGKAFVECVVAFLLALGFHSHTSRAVAAEGASPATPMMSVFAWVESPSGASSAQGLAGVCSQPEVTALCRPRGAQRRSVQRGARPALVPGEESGVVCSARRPADAGDEHLAGSSP